MTRSEEAFFVALRLSTGALGGASESLASSGATGRCACAQELEPEQRPPCAPPANSHRTTHYTLCTLRVCFVVLLCAARSIGARALRFRQVDAGDMWSPAVGCFSSWLFVALLLAHRSVVVYGVRPTPARSLTVFGRSRDVRFATAQRPQSTRGGRGGEHEVD